jgi:pSer/pThr/pTyr-binding forkhead associated (FHA) protein
LLIEGPDAEGEAAVAAAEAALAAEESARAAASADEAQVAGRIELPPELLTLAGATPGKVFVLDKDRTSLGRLPDSDVLLSDPGASRRHAEIRRQDGEWVIADLGSTNGTMVNELTIGERPLQNGDRITIGRTVLEFRRR